MAARYFDEEMAEEADALQKHIAKQLSKDGPHAKLLDVLESLRSFKARWCDPKVIDHEEQIVMDAPAMVVHTVPLMEAALGVKPSGPCECTCGGHEGH